MAVAVAVQKEGGREGGRERSRIFLGGLTEAVHRSVSHRRAAVIVACLHVCLRICGCMLYICVCACTHTHT